MSSFDLLALLSTRAIEHRALGRPSPTFDEIAPPDEARERSLVYIRRPNETTIPLLRSSKAKVFLLPREWGDNHVDELLTLDASVVLVDQPRRVVATLLRAMHPDEDLWPPGVHPTAIVDPRAVVDPSVSVGPYAVIGRAVIGKDSCVGAFAVIKDDVTVGERVIVREHCLVGGAGFGFVREDDARLQRVPHIGGVIIEDDVEIFPYANVDRGTIAPTRVGRGSKLDHYVHVGHNTSVGEDTVLTARVVLCGKARIGDRAWLGVGAIVKEGIAVGDDTTVGLGSVVLRNVENGATVVGVPAKPISKKQ